MKRNSWNKLFARFRQAHQHRTPSQAPPDFADAVMRAVRVEAARQPGMVVGSVVDVTERAVLRFALGSGFAGAAAAVALALLQPWGSAELAITLFDLDADMALNWFLI
jgi:hypothetical protein